MANAEIVAIGSELLLGQIVDTNSAWMAQRLTALGVNLYFKSVVGDNPGADERSHLARAGARRYCYHQRRHWADAGRSQPAKSSREVTGRNSFKTPACWSRWKNTFAGAAGPMTPNNIRQSYMPGGAIPVKIRTARRRPLSSKIRAESFSRCPACRWK